MLVDTGAVVSLLNMQDYLKYFPQVKLLKSHFTIHNHSEQVISNLGFFHGTVQYHGKSASVKIFVTETGTSLLGLDAVHALQMVIVGGTLTCVVDPPTSILPSAPLELNRYSTQTLGEFRSQRTNVFTSRIRRQLQRSSIDTPSAWLRM
ncbi:hypothetical protein MTO96_041309 [Rhipicephalus appendiculatus]